MTEDRRRTIDEKFEVQALQVAEAAVVEAAVAEATAVETVLERVEVSWLGAGYTWGD